MALPGEYGGERWGYHIVGGPEKAAQPETWHDRLVRLAREAEDASAAYDAANAAHEAAGEALSKALRASQEAYAALREATEASAILAAGGGQ